MLLYLQMDIPQSVCERLYHSVSSIAMNRNVYWIIVTGGARGLLGQYITGVECTMITEIGMCSHMTL